LYSEGEGKMSHSGGGEGAKLNLEELASKLTEIKDTIKDKTKFNVRDRSDKENKAEYAVKAMHYINTEGADEISTLESDINEMFSEEFSSLLRSFRVEKKLKSHNFRGKTDEEALDLSKELLGKILAHSLKYYYSLYGGDGKEISHHLVEKLESGKFDNDTANMALGIIYRGRKEGSPDFINLAKRFADYLTSRGSSFKDLNKDELKKVYEPFIQFATGHVNDIRAQPITYLGERPQEKEALDEVSKHLESLLPKPEKGTVTLNDATKSDMQLMLQILSTGYKVGFANKKDLGPQIDKMLTYGGGAEYKDVYK
jgi:biopolymer transport protein ExbD